MLLASLRICEMNWSRTENTTQKRKWLWFNGTAARYMVRTKENVYVGKENAPCNGNPSFRTRISGVWCFFVNSYILQLFLHSRYSLDHSGTFDSLKNSFYCTFPSRFLSRYIMCKLGIQKGCLPALWVCIILWLMPENHSCLKYAICMNRKFNQVFLVRTNNKELQIKSRGDTHFICFVQLAFNVCIIIISNDRKECLRQQ